MRPALLLLPGMLSDAEFWRAQMEGLTKVCVPRVVSYGNASSIQAMAEQVLKHAPPVFALAGHSMGGRVALEVLRQAPHRVTQLGLFCTDCRGFSSDEARELESLHHERLLSHARRHGMESLARQWFTGVVAPTQRSNPELMEAMVGMGARHSPEALAAELQAGLTRQDQSGILPTITCPALICAGELDPLRPPEGHDRMASCIRDARLVVVKDCGHMLAMERPEALTAAMLEWLQKDL